MPLSLTITGLQVRSKSVKLGWMEGRKSGSKSGWMRGRRSRWVEWVWRPLGGVHKGKVRA